MPKRHTRKGFYHKKGQKKGNRMKEYKELPELDSGEQNVVEKKIEDMTSNDLKDSIVDVASRSTSISTLTTSDTSSNIIGEIKTVSAAKTMVNSLEMLPSSGEQSEAFEIAMHNPIFCNFVKR